MAIDWFTVRAGPIKAIQHGIHETGLFETELTGPRTFQNINYPTAQTNPVNTTRESGNEFRHRIEANLVFERSRDYSYVDDVLHPMASVVAECMAALAATESVISYVPAEIEDFAGEMDNTSVLVLRIAFDVTTLVDLAET